MSYFGSRATWYLLARNRTNLSSPARFLPVLTADVYCGCSIRPARVRSAVRRDPHEAGGVAPHPPCRQPQVPAGGAAEVRTEDQEAGLALPDQVDQRAQGMPGGDAQEVSLDPARDRPFSGCPDRVEVLLVRKREVLRREDHRHRIGPHRDHVGDDQERSAVERAVKRHPLGARVDPDRERREDHRTRFRRGPDRSPRRDVSAVRNLRHRQEIVVEAIYTNWYTARLGREPLLGTR